MQIAFFEYITSLVINLISLLVLSRRIDAMIDDFVFAVVYVYFTFSFSSILNVDSR